LYKRQRQLNLKNKHILKTELFLARRIVSGKESKGSISHQISRIAIIGIALGLSVMIIAVAIVIGFKEEIRNKVIGFGSHIQLVNYDSNISFETSAVQRNQPFLNEIEKTKGIKHIQVFGTKPGIMKSGVEMQGIVLKGVDKNYDWSFFKTNLKKGRIIEWNDSTASRDIVISQWIASRLKLDVDSMLAVYFVQDPPRMRSFKVCGIYETGLNELDKMFVLSDLRHVQKLNDWSTDQVSGFEILVNDFNNIDTLTKEVQDITASSITQDKKMLQVLSIKEKYPQIFDWLDLQDMNVWIILILMMAVAGINMVSGLLVLILDRVRLVGVLKALGSDDAQIRRLFTWIGTYLLFKGIIWGNIIGIGLCLIQHYTGIIKLDQTSYYISQVPVNLNITYLILLNIGTIILSFFILLLPGMVISRLDPIKILRYE
jgi:lipoprotein-releasing system permease protein